MIRASIMYPNQPGARFNWDYYMNKHIPAVRQLTSKGLARIEVDRGIATAQPGAPAPFVCAAHMYFNNMDDFQKCMTASTDLMADIPNFSSVQPQIQISEVL
jgi:uncharacterized protein (TIGR02118 family)